MAGRGVTKAYLTTGQAAQRLGVSRFTVLRAVRRGEIVPAQQTPGGYHRFDAAAVTAYAERLASASGRAQPVGPAGGSATEERLRTLYATMACGVLALKADGTITDVNEAARRILGLEAAAMGDQLLGRGLAATTNEDGCDLPTSQRPIQVALRTGLPQREVIMGITRLDGAQRWLQVDAVPIMDASGHPREVVASFIDITARMQAEEALRASEQQYRSVTQLAHEAIISADAQGHIISWNRGAQHIFGYAEEEALGQPLTLLMPARYRQAQQEGLAQATATGHFPFMNRTVEVLGLRKDGTEFAAEMSLATWVIGASRYYSSIVRDITARKRAEEALRTQALHDGLTGLPNRTLLYDRLDQALRAIQRERQHLALLLLDLDHFKEVNDTLGHHYGDLLLRQVAERLCHAVRATDTVARLGGDEFAVLLPQSDMDGAAQVARAILAAFVEPFDLDSQRVVVGTSIGIALAPTHGVDGPTLLRHADVAMYAAKRTGGGYISYAPEHDQHSPRRLALISALRQALVRDELCLHYQPKVDVDSGVVACVEALVRWQHPEQGLLLPDQFIPQAEQTGLINPLTRWVLDRALRDCRDWAQQGLGLSVAVNLSMCNLVDTELPETIAALLQTYELPPERLRVELTETAIMADATRATAVLLRLAGLGVRIAVDDFGTGYSSLAYLKRLPIDEIKIDRSFVMNMSSDGDDATIVASTIGLGHSLGLSFVAEGVENEATWKALSALGCDAAQGYYLSHPLPAADLLRWMGESSRPARHELSV